MYISVLTRNKLSTLTIDNYQLSSMVGEDKNGLKLQLGSLPSNGYVSEVTLSNSRDL